MLDRLLGRASLKERIAELEDQRDRLKEQLEAEERRRADAVSDRQEAEERVNRLEDRIAELEDRVERAGQESASAPTFRYRNTIRGGRLATVVDRLASVDAPPEGAITAYVTDEVPTDIADRLGERRALIDRASPCLICIDDAGIVEVGLDLVDPPAPFCERNDSFRLDRSWLEPRNEYAVALVRSDLFAVGTYVGEDRIDVRGFQTNVPEDHSKGGFSQSRFERLREGAIQDHLERAEAVLDDVATDRLFVVGSAELLSMFEDRATATTAVDATGDPESALSDAVRDLWTVTMYGF